MVRKREKKERKEFFFFKQKTAYEIYQCDWSSDVCSSDLSAMQHDDSPIASRRMRCFIKRPPTFGSAAIQSPVDDNNLRLPVLNRPKKNH